MECRQTFPIAITGFGVRLPGNVHDETTLWDLVRSGRDGIVDIPSDRWDIDRFYDPDPDKPGKMYVKKGGFLQAPIDEFDALYFGITPREAACMDPQQRLMLQVTWEALHSAGIVPEQLAGTRTGVYVGAFTTDNLLHQMGPLGRDLIGAHTAVGSTMTILSNRISYLLDLRGPSLSIDTACSSSLVAVHHACEAIRSGHCDAALVGGVNAIFRPEYFIAMCKGQFLAKDGYCKSFDERADGYARGEGAAAIVLKPLAQAQRDGDIVHGVIRNTGVNQDGRSQGITSPNADAQVALIEEVHGAAGVAPTSIGYVEAHGTGTQAGDTAESDALGRALGKHRPASDPLPVGSIKANIGHLEAASGLAGLIKTCLCLKHRQIPPIANLGTANPRIPFEELGIHLPRKSTPMKASTDTAYAAVNSFGYGGTNAHVLLEEPSSPPRQAPRCDGPHLLTISAKEQSSLAEMAIRHKDSLQSDTSVDLTNYCYSAAVRRSHHQHRLAVCADSRRELLDQLAEYAERGRGDGVAVGEAVAPIAGPVFVFTGMGPQWWAMGRELYHGNRVFREAAQACDEAFITVSGWSILKEMLADESDSRMAATTIAQPANFLLQAALTAVWKSRGIEPAAIVGHSVGEVTAAYVAGVLTLAEAAQVSYHRSQLQSRAAGLGGMLAVDMNAEDATALLREYADEIVDIAAVNAPGSMTFSGDLRVLDDIAARLEEQGVFQRKLQVEVPYHSAYMDPIMDDMMAALASLQPQEPHTPLYSTVTGEQVLDGQHDALYWFQNARQPVLFAPAMDRLLQTGHEMFLEVGPHPVLSGAIGQCAAATGKRIGSIASLRRKEREYAQIQTATAQLYAAGCSIDWRAVFPADCSYVPLPLYAWQPTSYWVESQNSQRDRLARPEHPLLGLRQNSPEPLWTSRINQQSQPYVNDHQVEDLVVLPGAAYVELGLAAHKHLFDQKQWVIEDLRFFNALVVAHNDEPELQTRHDHGTGTFSIHSKSRDADRWEAHATGRLSILPPAEPKHLALGELLEVMDESRSMSEHYEDMHARGLQYGPSFQAVEQVWRHEACLVAQIIAPESIAGELGEYCLHPAILDACFQSLLGVLPKNDRRAFVPTNIRQVRFYDRPGELVYCYAEVDSLSEHTLSGSLTICDKNGRVLVELTGIEARALSLAESLSERELNDWLYEFDWERLESPAQGPGGRWAVLGDLESPGSLAARAARQLSNAGVDLVRIVYADEFERRRDTSFRVRATSAADITRVADATAELPCAGLLVFPPHVCDASNLSEEKTLSALAVIQGIAASSEARIDRLCFATQGAQPVTLDAGEMALNETGIVGLLRVAANEYPEYSFRSIDLDARADMDALVGEVLSDSTENEIALRGSDRLALRMVRREAQELQEKVDERIGCSEEFVVASGANGVALKAAGVDGDIPAGVKIRVKACTTLASDLLAGDGSSGPAPDEGGLTLRLLLCEVLPHDDKRGIAPGTEAVTLSSAPPASHLVVAPENLIPLNADRRVSAERLSSVLWLVAARRALVDIAALDAGQSVLIHGGDTPLGMAAIRVATARRAEVYACTELGAEADRLIELGVRKCFSSKTLEFSEQLRRITAGRGVDVVLNLTGGEIAEHSVRLVKSGGRLLNFHDGDLTVKAGIHVHMLSMDKLLSERPSKFRTALDAVCEALVTDDCTPLPESRIEIGQLKTFEPSDLRGRAFTLAITRQTSDELFRASAMAIDAGGTYLVTGGFGGFGQLIVRHLVARGARHLVIVSRGGARSDDARALLAELQADGVKVRAPQVDVGDPESVAALFERDVAAMPPLKGIVHAAGVLADSPVSFIERSHLETVMGPKVRGAWNLHEQSLTQPLDFFVLFSSVASMIGAAGQGTYVIANAWLDAFAHQRRSMGLPATSISWGALGDVGMAAIDPDVVAYFERVGLRAISPPKAIESFARLLDWQLPHLGLVDMDWRLWGSWYPAWAKSQRYAHLVPQLADDDAEGGDWLQALAGQPEQDQVDQILGRLLALVALAFDMPVEKLDGNCNLPALGIDSLLAMGLQTDIQQEMHVRVSTLELMKGNSLRQIAAHVRDKCLDDAAPTDTERTEPEPVAQDAYLDDLDEAQVDDLLAELNVA